MRPFDERDDACGVMSQAVDLAAGGRIEAAEQLLRTAADRAVLARRPMYFGLLSRLLLQAGREAAAAVWNQQAIAAALAAGQPPDLALAAEIANGADAQPPSDRNVVASETGDDIGSRRLSALALWFISTEDWNAAAVAAEFAARRAASPAEAAARRRLRGAIAAMAVFGPRDGRHSRPI